MFLRNTPRLKSIVGEEYIEEPSLASRFEISLWGRCEFGFHPDLQFCSQAKILPWTSFHRAVYSREISFPSAKDLFGKMRLLGGNRGMMESKQSFFLCYLGKIYCQCHSTMPQSKDSLRTTPSISAKPAYPTCSHGMCNQMHGILQRKLLEEERYVSFQKNNWC